MADEKKEYCAKFEDHKLKNLLWRTDDATLDVVKIVQWCEICGHVSILTTVDGREFSRDNQYKPKIFQDWCKANGLLPEQKEAATPP